MSDDKIDVLGFIFVIVFVIVIVIVFVIIFWLVRSYLLITLINCLQGKNGGKSLGRGRNQCSWGLRTISQ